MKFKRLALAGWLTAAVVVPVALAAIRTDVLTVTGLTTTGNLTVTGTATIAGIALPAPGVAGGVPYFSTTNALTSSGLLTNHAPVVGGGSGGAPDTIAAGTTGQVLYGVTGSNPSFATPASNMTTPGDPSPTGSLVGVMMGLAGGITPTSTGRIMMLISGDVSNDTSSDGASVQCAFGTGAAPVNGAAASGTNVGNPVKLVNGATPTVKIPTLCQGIVTGLTPNIALWLDVNLAAISGGTATLADVTISAHEF